MAPESGGSRAVRVTVAGVGDQPVRDPQQAQTTHQHQAGDLQQPDHAQGHQAAHGNRPHRAPDDGFFLQGGGQLAGRQGDHDGVVASQDEVDQDNGQQGGPPGGRQEFHEQLSPKNFANLRNIRPEKTAAA